MTLAFGTVNCDLDLTSAGKRAGHFSLTHSDNRHGFSSIMAPLGVVKGQEGPVALICAGNHGDEYEGQIIVRRLFDSLTPEDLSGGLILAPALNMPAMLDANRVSPLDGGNLNRLFPGKAGAGPTREIAGFVATHLMSSAALAIDLHSGGKATNYVDSAYFCLSHDAARNTETRTLAEIMGLPFTLVVPPGDTAGDFDSAAHAAGCAMLSCELGGDGRLSRRSLERGWQGVLRVLMQQGILRDEAAKRLGMNAATPSRFLDLGGGAATVTAHRHGLVELLAGLAETVARGQTLALLHDPYSINATPVAMTAPHDGIVAVRRTATLVAPGDHLFIIAPEYTPDDLAELT